jgi:hypothetical protein
MFYKPGRGSNPCINITTDALYEYNSFHLFSYTYTPYRCLTNYFSIIFLNGRSPQQVWNYWLNAGIYDSFNGCNKHYSKQRVWDSRRAGKSIHLKTDNYTGLFIALCFHAIYSQFVVIPILTGIEDECGCHVAVLWERCFADFIHYQIYVDFGYIVRFGFSYIRIFWYVLLRHNHSNMTYKTL